MVVGFQILGKAPQFLVTRTLLSLLRILHFVFQTCLNVYISLEVGQNRGAGLNAHLGVGREQGQTFGGPCGFLLL